MSTYNLGLPTWDEGNTEPNLVFNQELYAVDALIQLTPEAITSAPPSTPTVGQAWIVGASPTGSWTGHTLEVAVAVTGGWVFYEPVEGWLAYVKNTAGGFAQGTYQFDGSAWNQLTFGDGIPDAPEDGQEYVRQDGAWVVNSGGGGGVELDNTSPWTKNQYVSPVVVASATGTYTPDSSASNNFQLTLTGNLTLANPTNLVQGMVLNFCLDEDSTGGRTITLGTAYKWPGGIVPTWITSASAKNFFSAYYDGTILRCSGGAGYA